MMPSRLSLDMAHARQADLRHEHHAAGAPATATVAGAHQWHRRWRLATVSRRQLRPA